ncbi:hypothetical protein JB92DRAFT_3104283 [Gautieria morchelliformis]|nr:hypothetical protein JB92DRAFT_3104283 [Gautieria morchelliformis]
MNNLLKTIGESPLKAALQDADLKLLLSSVRDVRSQDAKAADSFYGSLEGVLLELRTVTADNRDAEAFLKPVSKLDYPDYYELIKHPMDLATMLKHVKARKYKSKKEFAADLGLIWKNCLKYNTGPDHVLRGCVMRLQRKADHLLAHVSDRPDHITINGLPTPSAPPSSTSSRDSPYKPVKINGIVNGILPRDIPTPDPSTPRAAQTPNTPGRSNTHSKSPRSASGHGSPAKPSPSALNATPFEDQPALVRTPAAMSLFMTLDGEMQRVLQDAPEETGMLPMMGFDHKGKGKETLQQRLRDIIDEDMMSVDGDDDPGPHGEAGNSIQVVGGHLKRKWLSDSQDSRKRPRLAESFSSNESGLGISEKVEEDLLEAWWEASRSNSLVVGGVPSLPQFDGIGDRKQKAGKGPGLRPARAAQGGRKRTTRKRTSILSRSRKPAKSLLKLMNKNIATMVRVRRTHAKFVTLNAAAESSNPVVPAPEPASEHEADEMVLDEEEWRTQGEVNWEAGDECLSWMGSKVLQHAGFQGSSTAALNVLTSVTSEYLQNVGRTIRFLCDKYSNTMTPEEIILHTLFEGGTTKIQDLERYIKDDVVRYGSRLGDLEKKLVGAYRDITTVEAPNDEGMFEDGDEADNIASGGLADMLGSGEDFLGLRELGIEAEFGLKSLAVPKRLWKGKPTGEDLAAPDRAKAGDPPLAFPPPPPFIPLESSRVDSQIGLLKNFYQERFTALAASSANPPPPNPNPVALPILAPPTNPYSFANPYSSPYPSASTLSASSAQPVAALSMSLVLPDDPPNPMRSKVGPLGQVILSNPPTAGGKKKGKAKEANVDRGNDKDGKGAVSGQKKETKKRKGKDEQGGGAAGGGNPANPEVNGTGPKKKPKSAGTGKKSINNAKLDIPPAIIASA